MHEVASNYDEWLSKRLELLALEKEMSRQRDALAQKRQELPWLPVTKEYAFTGPNGTLSLADMFDGRSQLIIYHFMFGPGWEEGCDGCSFLSDHIDAANLHLPHHDVTLAVVSRAPFEEFQEFKKRMGWKFTWVSSHESDFNFDYGVSFRKGEPSVYNYESFVPEEDDLELPGMSCFFRDESGQIFHTYSSYARGGDLLIGTYNWLDIAPLGRNEDEIMNWVRLHDEY